MKNKIDRVFIIGIDGAGNWIKDTETPNIHGILKEGVLTYSAQATYPTISAECWGSMLHGVSPEKHKLNNLVVESNTYAEDSPYPSVFKIIKNAWPESKLAAFSCWGPINNGIIEQSAQDHSESLPDAELVGAVATYIQQNPDLKLMFVQLDETDGAGHKYGYGTRAHLDSITVADCHVGVIIEAIRDAGLLDSSLIIINSDHGGGGENAYSHGSNHPQDMTVFWGCHGPGINPMMDLEGIQNMDTAAIVLHALGLGIPGFFEGRLPIGLFLGS